MLGKNGIENLEKKNLKGRKDIQKTFNVLDQQDELNKEKGGETLEKTDSSAVMSNEGSKKGSLSDVRKIEQETLPDIAQKLTDLKNQEVPSLPGIVQEYVKVKEEGEALSFRLGDVGEDNLGDHIDIYSRSEQSLQDQRRHCDKQIESMQEKVEKLWQTMINNGSKIGRWIKIDNGILLREKNKLENESKNIKGQISQVWDQIRKEVQDWPGDDKELQKFNGMVGEIEKQKKEIEHIKSTIRSIQGKDDISKKKLQEYNEQFNSNIRLIEKVQEENEKLHPQLTELGRQLKEDDRLKIHKSPDDKTIINQKNEELREINKQIEIIDQSREELNKGQKEMLRLADQVKVLIGEQRYKELNDATTRLIDLQEDIANFHISVRYAMKNEAAALKAIALEIPDYQKYKNYVVQTVDNQQQLMRFSTHVQETEEKLNKTVQELEKTMMKINWHYHGEDLWEKFKSNISEMHTLKNKRDENIKRYEETLRSRIIKEIGLRDEVSYEGFRGVVANMLNVQEDLLQNIVYIQGRQSENGNIEKKISSEKFKLSSNKSLINGQRRIWGNINEKLLKNEIKQIESLRRITSKEVNFSKDEHQKKLKEIVDKLEILRKNHLDVGIKIQNVNADQNKITSEIYGTESDWQKLGQIASELEQGRKTGQSHEELRAKKKEEIDLIKKIDGNEAQVKNWSAYKNYFFGLARLKHNRTQNEALLQSTKETLDSFDNYKNIRYREKLLKLSINSTLEKQMDSLMEAKGQANQIVEDLQEVHRSLISAYDEIGDTKTQKKYEIRAAMDKMAGNILTGKEPLGDMKVLNPEAHNKLIEEVNNLSKTAREQSERFRKAFVERGKLFYGDKMSSPEEKALQLKKLDKILLEIDPRLDEVD